jgi:hypothetical protein
MHLRLPLGALLHIEALANNFGTIIFSGWKSTALRIVLELTALSGGLFHVRTLTSRGDE